jgi:DNA-binding GntR family transcriptional regulator
MTKMTSGLSPPRYMQILSILRARVEDGRYPLETSLPSEGELCEEFAASRYTVREALRRLVEQGMVSRRQGSGSVVVASQPQARYVHSLSSLAGLFQFALETHYEVISIDKAILSDGLAEQVGGEPGSVWNLVKGIRRDRAGGEVVSFTHSYIPNRLTRHVEGLPGCIGPFYAQLSRVAREEILEAEQEIRGEPMDEEIAGHLGRKTGDIAICALRRYTTAKGPIITSLNWHIAENFAFQMKLLKNL